MKQICGFHWAPEAKRFSASGGLGPLTPDQGLCPWTPLDPRCRLALPALAMRVHPTIFDLATPLEEILPRLRLSSSYAPVDDDLVECSVVLYHEALVHIAFVFQCDPVYQGIFGKDSRKHSYK